MKVAFLIHSFPTYQVFTMNELEAWRRLGLDVHLIALTKPHSPLVGCTRMQREMERTTYVAELPLNYWMRGILIAVRNPRAAFQTLSRVVTAPCLRSTTWKQRVQSLMTWLASIPLAAAMQKGQYDHIHAEFADSAATAAWIVHQLSGLSYSFRSHTSYNPQLLPEKVRDATFVLAISHYDKELISDIVGVSSEPKTYVNYLGVSTTENSTSRPPSSENPALIACVGTLQEKKGQRYLIRSCRLLMDQSIPFRCVLIGDGPTRKELEDEIAHLELQDHVAITGYLPNEAVMRLVAEASVVCLPCTYAANGDVDGIPYSLMEAMALGRPCVSTWVSGIPELIADGVDGLLVRERDPISLASALAELLRNRPRHEHLGAAAREKVRRSFNLDRNANDGVRIFKECVQPVHERGEESRRTRWSTLPF